MFNFQTMTNKQVEYLSNPKKLYKDLEKLVLDNRWYSKLQLKGGKQ